MVETVKVRPNHYEALGLTPAASSEEIAQAFAREVNLIPVLPLGTFAQVSAAFEALRDPVRRMAYDATLAPPPKPSHSLIGRLERPPLEERLPAKAADTEVLPRVDPDVPESAPAPKPTTAPSTDGILSQPPEPRADPSRQWSEPTEQYFEDQMDWRELEREARADRSVRPDVGGLVLNTAVGGALLLAIVLGAWTGLESGSDNPQASATLPISLATPAPATDATPPPSPSSSSEQLERPKESPQVAARVEPARRPLQIDLPDEIPANPAPAAKDQTSEASTTGELASEPAAPAVGTAKLPLPDAVVARTIGRIGYACRQVASTTPMEGEAPGTFKVTCTSGDSYRAAPVNGRYRFRRLGGR